MMIRKLISLNQRASRRFDRLLLSKSWRVDGLADYTHNIVPPLIKTNSRICDVGGGKRPFVGYQIPKVNQYIIGIDIDENELSSAPKGIYDKIIVSDISENILANGVDASIVICEAVLEHVHNTPKAISNIAKLTSHNGVVALFVPSRFALFAVINRWLPEKMKKKLLYGIFPETEHAQGFPAFYDHCTPRKISKLLEENNVKIQQITCYYQSTYFSFFLPAHIFWRVYQLISYLILGRNAAESFTIIGIKK